MVMSRLWCMVYGVWCVVYGVAVYVVCCCGVCLVYGVWCMVNGELSADVAW